MTTNSLEHSTQLFQDQWNDALTKVASLQDLEGMRVAFLGKKGALVALFAQLGRASIEEKRQFGSSLNALKKSCDVQIREKKEELIRQQAAGESARASAFDVSAYTPNQVEGSLHPYTRIVHEVEDIFMSMGFELLDGPEVETDYRNFTALNIPTDHPARDMYDTFWLNTDSLLMRTHTSTVQIRAMAEKPLPLAGIATGRVFRHEAVDASHDHTFLQCEGIVIDKNINLSHLFGVLKTLIGKLFGTDQTQIRTRPGFFPFVEPGVEIDMRCPFCKTGCATCKKTCWIEVFPGGMIHPNVLREAGIDPEVYSGFAFGFGLTRLAMLKYGIADIRAFHSGKKAFLDHFA